MGTPNRASCWTLPLLAWNHGRAVADSRGAGKPPWLRRVHEAYWVILWPALLAAFVILTMSPWHSIFARGRSAMVCVWHKRKVWHLYDFTSYPRGTGEGSLLLEDVLAVADREQVAVTLDTRTERLARFYGRHGFKKASETARRRGVRIAMVRCRAVGIG